MLRPSSDRDMKVKKIIARFFMVPATFMYILGIVSRGDFYRFIGSIEPELRTKLEEALKGVERARAPRES